MILPYIDDATITSIRKKHPIKEIVERYVTLTKKEKIIGDYAHFITIITPQCPYQQD